MEYFKNFQFLIAKFYFYFINSKDFLEIWSSKKKCLDDLHFLNILAVRIGLGTLKAAWWDWSGNSSQFILTDVRNRVSRWEGKPNYHFSTLYGASKLKHYEFRAYDAPIVLHCVTYREVIFCLRHVWNWNNFFSF